MSKAGDNFLKHPPEFSLVLGGPLYQLLRKTHLADDALTHLRKRVLVISLLSWLPLLVLSALEGNVLDGGTAVPFLMDVEVHVRFLIAMPLFVLAELVVHQRMRFLLAQFLERRLIPDSAMERFEAAVASAFRLRNSVVAELLLIAFVYLVGVLIVWRHYVALDAATWYGAPGIDGTTLTLAGIWYGYVSIPFFQFLMLRWYFRMFIWLRFLWHVSRLELNLMPTHPDRAGGLGFLSETVYAYIPLLMAHGAMLAGYIANRIFFLGAALPDFKVEIGVVVVYLLFLVFGPLLVFAPQLEGTRRAGRRAYGAFAQRYVSEFDAKWVRGGGPADEPVLGTPDIQSLADLGNAYSVVQGMRSLLVTKEAILRLAVAVLVPIAPLALTMMPLEELLKKLLGVLF